MIEKMGVIRFESLNESFSEGCVVDFLKNQNIEIRALDLFREAIDPLSPMTDSSMIDRKTSRNAAQIDRADFDFGILRI